MSNLRERLRGDRSHEGPAEKLFFDIENGLLVRWDMARPTEALRFVKVYLDDYKDVGGVKVPISVRFSF